MPRPNQARTIASESALARRIAALRETRNMSYEGLSIQMKHVGCPIDPSALHRIEKGKPQRRITVDELVAFGQVFGVAVEQLLLPPELVAADELAELVVAWNRAQDKAITAQRDEAEAWERVQKWVEQHPEYGEKVEAVMRHWSELYFEDGHDFRVARRMWELTKDPTWGDRAKVALDALVEESREN